MGYVHIKLNGRTVIHAQIKQRITIFVCKVGEVVQGAGIDMQAEAKRLAPVGTPESTGIRGYRGGRLRSSIQYIKVSQFQCRVGTNVYYAIFVECGTYKMRAQPFMLPASIKTKRTLLTELKALVI